MEVPKTKQLANYLSQYKKKKYGDSSISLGELEQWCEDHSAIPANENEPFVVNYNIVYHDEIEEDDDNDEYDDKDVFRFFVSSKRLLNIASQA